LSHLAPPLLAGWLASGSCIYVGCYEDCDPCYQECVCKKTCEHALAAESAYGIATAEARVERDSAGRSVRTLSGIVGPSLELVRGPGPHDAAEVARFARAVLEVNAERVPCRAGSEWALEALERFEAAWVAHYRAVPRWGARLEVSNTVSMLFDGDGRLVELAQAFEHQDG
jgi:hypothetical protein